MVRHPSTAISGEEHSFYQDDLSHLGELIERDSKQIMERWFQRAIVEQVHSSRKEREEVMNDLRTMLQVIGRRLSLQSAKAFTEATDTARNHARQRAQFGWDIVNLVKDYEILHGVVLEYLGEALKDRLTYRQSAALVTILDRAIGSAVETFNIIVHERLEEVNAKLENQVAKQKEEIRELLLSQTEVEYREREKFAQTLHDDFQQILVAMKMKLHQGIREVSLEIPALNDAEALLKEMLAVSRNVSGDLFPVVLENQPFPAAIQWLAEIFQQRYNLDVTVEVQVFSQSDLGSKPLRKLIYNIVRELLFNVVKHAQTDKAWVRISCEDDSIWIFEIEDFGVGFPESEKHYNACVDTCIGIESIAVRIQKIGGTMKVASHPGKGTKVVFRVPLAL